MLDLERVVDSLTRTRVAGACRDGCTMLDLAIPEAIALNVLIAFTRANLAHQVPLFIVEILELQKQSVDFLPSIRCVLLCSPCVKGCSSVQAS